MIQKDKIIGWGQEDQSSTMWSEKLNMLTKDVIFHF